MPPAPIRSRKVRKILALEARARRLLRRYERALDRAHGIEWTLAGGQIAALHRGRAEQGSQPTPRAAAAAPPSSPPTTSL